MVKKKKSVRASREESSKKHQFRRFQKMFILRKTTTKNYEYLPESSTWNLYRDNQQNSPLKFSRQTYHKAWQNRYLSSWIQGGLTGETNKGTDRATGEAWQNDRGGLEKWGKLRGKGNWQRPHKTRDFKKNRENAQKIPTRVTSSELLRTSLSCCFVLTWWCTLT